MSYPYELVNSYVGESLIKGFDFQHSADLSHGYVCYQDKDAAKEAKLWEVKDNDAVILRADYEHETDPDGEGRMSVRIESQESWTHGLFIGDFAHMPKPACGLWPAFWAYGDDWPNNGEINIIEGANLAQVNLMSGHTGDGCMLPTKEEAQFSAKQLTVDCAVSWKGSNVGCGYGVRKDDVTSYGDGFNDCGGGVYAMEWDDKFIKIWHFEKAPGDIAAKKPNPESWGVPLAVFGGSMCSVDSHFKAMRLVLNIDFCGDYAGNVWSNEPQCAGSGYEAKTCKEYVAKNPDAYKDAFWEVNSISVYQKPVEKKEEEYAESYSTSKESYATTTASAPYKKDYKKGDTDKTVTSYTSTNHVTVTIPWNYPGIPQQYPMYKDEEGCPYPAPGKGGELPTTYIATTSIEYTRVCPSDSAKLEPTYYEHTYTLSDCHCGETSHGGYKYEEPTMTTSVYSCLKCGPAGEDYVTLSVPHYSEPTTTYASSTDDNYKPSASAAVDASPKPSKFATAGGGRSEAVAGLAVFVAAAVLFL